MTVLTFPRFFAVLLLLSFSACIVVKNPPQNKPFVYQTNVHVEGNLKEDTKKELAAGLAEQLHDSVKVRSVAKFAGWDKGPKLFYDVLNHPTVFDSLNAEKSRGFMNAYLNAQGYFRDSIAYRVKIDTVQGDRELRTYLDFYAFPRIPTSIDSIAYRLNADSANLSMAQRQSLDTLQNLTLNNKEGALIQKGDPFSKYKLSAERDRLATVYRNNGYLKFSEEEMLVLWDTVGIELLRPTLDPIEGARLLQLQAERRVHPKADVEFHLRENPDTTRTTRYYVGNVTVYPEFVNDTMRSYRYVDTVQSYIVKQNGPLFKKKIFPDNILLNRGDLYRADNVAKTQAKFNALNTWRETSILPRPRNGQDTADFDIYLTPARKYAFNASAEVTSTRNNLGFVGGNLLGFGITTGIQNRNFVHAANQSSLNLRIGVEGEPNIFKLVRAIWDTSFRDVIRTRQVNLGYNLSIPRLVPHFLRVLNRSKENNTASIFSFNAGLTDRRDYFNLASLNTSWGYQFGWRNRQVTVRFPNIEYNYLIRKDSLEALIQKNASYKYIFNTGVVVSLLANYSDAKSSEKNTQLFTATAEVADVPGLLRNTFATTLYRFVKADVEFRRTKKYFRNALALRGFFGIGVGMPFSSLDLSNRFLPFYREYFGGGPNSMRAWSLRKLGPGSTVKSFGSTDAPDRFGDVRLEGNVEYRIFLTSYRGIGINTALYTDVGNIWFLRDNPDFPGGRIPGTVQKFWKDLAIGVGTGLRVDFGFFKFRLDYAYKAKDPSPNPENAQGQNVWFYKWKPLEGKLQLGIDYPF